MVQEKFKVIAQRVFTWLVGGRPMKKMDSFPVLYDAVTGRPVYHFRDKYNRDWMAYRKWSLFRVSIDD